MNNKLAGAVFDSEIERCWMISTVLLYSKCILVFPSYHEFKLIFLENHTEFWIRVKKLFEPIVLPRKGDGLLLFLK